MRKPNLPQTPAHSVPVYPAESFTATNGANMGDALSFAEELELDDTYALSPQARPVQLAIQVLDDGFEIATESPTGAPGAALHLDCALTLMSPDGQTTDSIVVVEEDGRVTSALMKVKEGPPKKDTSPKGTGLLAAIQGVQGEGGAGTNDDEEEDTSMI